MKNKIPKIIHYCWFGGKPLSPLAKACLKTWKKILPDYELCLWNEKNFDVKSNKFVYGAYKAKKWAYITDYVRLWALYNIGGLYMDTDVEVLKKLDRFLKHSAFSGFEDNDHIPTGLMAAEKGNLWIKAMLDYYKKRDFQKKELIPNTVIISKLSSRFGFKPGNKYQILEHDAHMYPREYFCPKPWGAEKFKIYPHTYTIHHFAGSWMVEDRLINKMARIILPVVIRKKLKKILKNGK